MQVTATVSFANPTDQFVKAQVGGGGAFDLTKATGNDWSGTFTVNPKDGQAANNGMQPVVISAKNSADPAVPSSTIGQASIQAGRAANQGPLANVELEHHAQRVGAAHRPDHRHVARARLQRDRGRRSTAPTAARAASSHISSTAAPARSRSRSGARQLRHGRHPSIASEDAPLASLTGDYNDRWAPNGTCTANNWPNVPTDDPRLTSVFLTDEIGGSPSGSSAITGFGAFYVTGWVGAPLQQRHHAGRRGRR